MSGVARVIDRIPVEPLREAYLRSGLTASEVCYRLDWVRPPSRQRWNKHTQYADITRLKRALGLAPHYNHSTNEYTSIAERISIDVAVRIADAIGVDPVDIGA